MPPSRTRRRPPGARRRAPPPQDRPALGPEGVESALAGGEGVEVAISRARSAAESSAAGRGGSPRAAALIAPIRSAFPDPGSDPAEPDLLGHPGDTSSSMLERVIPWVSEEIRLGRI